MSPPSEHRSRCPVVFALDLFGDRWTLLVIRDMVLNGSQTYTEFLNSGEGIATNILAERLRRLEDQGIVTKHEDENHAAKYRYRLTKKGLDLVPVIVEMIRWGARHQTGSPVPKAMRQRLDREPRKIAEEFIRRARARAR